jgi:hypothetical protein
MNELSNESNSTVEPSPTPPPTATPLSPDEV